MNEILIRYCLKEFQWKFPEFRNRISETHETLILNGWLERDLIWIPGSSNSLYFLDRTLLDLRNSSPRGV